MKKYLLFFMIVLIFFTSIDCTNTVYNLQAADDKSYYGDGVAAKWNEIAPYLSVLYRNTPYISISNGKTVKTFYFNIELFWDLGLYVYGEPNSVQFTGTVNDFKAATGGYFRIGDNSKPTLGEYRYLGYSISGVPITNSRFPTEMQSDGSAITLIKYSELPNNLKKLYEVNDYSNISYMGIKELIEHPLSPVWNFTTIVNNEEITLRQKLTQLGLYKNDSPTVALLDYGVVYSWAESGGIVRLFFRSGKYGEKYSYATFTGPVSVDFSMKYPNLEADMNVSGKPQNSIGKNTFYMGISDKLLSFDISLHGIMEDSLGSLSDFAKKYTYTRENMTDYSIIIDNKVVNDIKVDYRDSSVLFDGVLRGYKVYASQLLPGRNTFKISGLLKISFIKDNNVHHISAPCSVTITIIYEPIVSTEPTPSITPSVAPDVTSTEVPSASPEATQESNPSLLPTATPRIEVKRRW